VASDLRGLVSSPVAIIVLCQTAFTVAGGDVGIVDALLGDAASVVGVARH
jgi:hypothetical protein